MDNLYGKTGIKTEVVVELRTIARSCGVNKLVLFGSRARGDFWRASDIDLAVFGGNALRFAELVEINTSTLLRYDVVDLNGKVDQKLRDAIDKEGILLYEKV